MVTCLQVYSTYIVEPPWTKVFRHFLSTEVDSFEKAGSAGQQLQERSSDLMANGRPVFEKKAEASNRVEKSSSKGW